MHWERESRNQFSLALIETCFTEVHAVIIGTSSVSTPVIIIVYMMQLVSIVFTLYNVLYSTNF